MILKKEYTENKHDELVYWCIGVADGWNNNMRRRHSLPVLRGKMNKYRSKRYPCFHPTAKLFYLFDNAVSKEVEKKLENYFNSFAGIHDI